MSWSAARPDDLWRLKLVGSRVVYAEPLEIGERIRDLVETRDGSVVLWTDDIGSLVRLRPDRSANDGAVLFFRHCGNCHTVGEGAATYSIGPDLADVIDRSIGSTPGYRYSEGMRSLNGSWTRERLDSFLKDPERVAPGTGMVFPGVEDSEIRRAIIDYLSK